MTVFIYGGQTNDDPVTQSDDLQDTTVNEEPVVESDPPTATLTVDPGWSPLFTGESVTLRCEIQSESNWRYQWYKGSSGTAVSQSQTNTFTISPADQDQYWCRGERDNRPTSSQYSNPVTLTVEALPTATLTVDPGWSPLFTGESVTLKCEIQSYSSWRYQWYKGSSETAVSQSQTNTFTIRSAADQDQYWCRGERDDRPTSSQYSNPVTLTVEERPTPVVSMQPDNPVFSGEKVTLSCVIQRGGVSNWEYSWSKGGSDTPVSDEQQYSISSVTQSHSGTYTCRGTERGTSRSSNPSDITLSVSGMVTAVSGSYYVLTKDRCWDKAQVTPISIKGVSVDTVEDYKYLGVHIDNKLDWAKNTDALYKKGQSRLYFLRRLRSFNICRTMLRIFYESVVASAILYAVACWGSRLRVADANRLNKLIRKASDVVGVELDSLMAVSERRTLSKLQTIMDNGSHPLYHTVMRHRSTFSARLIQPKCTTERHSRIKPVPPVESRLPVGEERSRDDDPGVCCFPDGVQQCLVMLLQDVTLLGRDVVGPHMDDHGPEGVSGAECEKPKPTVRVYPQSSVYTGDTVTLTCEVGQSTGWSFIWYKGSQSLQSQNPADKNPITVSVRVSDVGTAGFTCEAHRGEYYTQRSDPAEITVT
ncbi:hypothetical protein NFI96_012248, partial [Prochilodus magdalenae]